MALQLALGCVDGVHRKCDCCPKPTVTIAGASVATYSISNADYASITIECEGSSSSTTPITLTSGAATGTYDPDGSVCFVTISATNECGTTVKYWRNYTSPGACDCIIEAFDPPSLWGRSGAIATTISGTMTAQPLIIGGITLCPSPAACGDISGTYVQSCGTPNKRYLITTATGCSNYHYYIDLLIISRWITHPTSGGGFQSDVLIQSGWFRKSTNPYPTLTQVTLGTSIGTLLNPSPADAIDDNYSRQRIISKPSQDFFAPSLRMIKCATGELDTVASDSSSSSGSGHCDASGLTITAEVI